MKEETKMTKEGEKTSSVEFVSREDFERRKESIDERLDRMSKFCEISSKEHKERMAAIERELEESRRQREQRQRDIDRQIAERRAEVDRQIAERKAEVNQQIAEWREETNQKIAERKAEVDRQIAERKAEVDRQIAEWREETNQKIAASDRRLKVLERNQANSDRKFKQLFNQVTTQHGRIIEAMVTKPALKLFRKSGIMVTHCFTEIHRHLTEEQIEMEIDALLVDSTVAVAVEVKSHCTKKDIDHFVQQMHHFKTLFHEYANMNVYVAVAALSFNRDADKYAREKGLFVLYASPEDTFSMESPPEEKRMTF